MVKNNITYFNANDKLTQVLKEFCEKGLKQAPVIYEGRVAGVIEALDLLNYMYKSNNPVISAKEIMKKDFCITYNDTPLDEINSLDFDG
ncbi:CBS domain-containing protein [Proteiniborus sp.]|uniref:CBS domain-containing protein n=1 Tax=Proteiniborus sp. TaxID=2079015 RepID=UPI00332A62B3